MSERGLRALHTEGRDVTVVDDVELARYVYRPDLQPLEAPKPYLHPIRTLAGDVVINYRPHDHRWHKGLQLTATDVSGHNLWGGHTYVAGTGYTLLDNVGMMRPAGPISVDTDGDHIGISHALTWTTAAGEVLAGEQRRLNVHGAGVWVLGWSSRVRNERPDPLVFGSPATRGLAGSGYTGLWWRGPPAFTGGRVVVPGGEVDPDLIRGQESPWLAFIGQHDGVDRSSTLVFCHGPANDEYPAHWFVRSAEFAAVNPSWAFHNTFELAPGHAFCREYRIAVIDGEWDAANIGRWYEEQSW